MTIENINSDDARRRAEGTQTNLSPLDHPQKIEAKCAGCDQKQIGFLIPDGRFICPGCHPPAIYQRWVREYAPVEKQHQREEKERIKQETAEKERAFQKKLAEQKEKAKQDLKQTAVAPETEAPQTSNGPLAFIRMRSKLELGLIAFVAVLIAAYLVKTDRSANQTDKGADKAGERAVVAAAAKPGEDGQKLIEAEKTKVAAAIEEELKPVWCKLIFKKIRDLGWFRRMQNEWWNMAMQATNLGDTVSLQRCSNMSNRYSRLDSGDLDNSADQLITANYNYWFYPETHVIHYEGFLSIGYDGSVIEKKMGFEADCKKIGNEWVCTEFKMLSLETNTTR